MEDNIRTDFEEYKVPGFDEYTVTKQGAIYHNGKMLKPQYTGTKSSCPRITLYRNGKAIAALSMGRVMALTFLPHEQKKSSDVIGFKDGNPHNWALDNICWVSRSKAYKLMYNKEARYSEKRLNNLKKALSKPVYSYFYNSNKKIIKSTHNSIREAADAYETSSSSISFALKHPNNKCVGLYWAYCEGDE